MQYYETREKEYYDVAQGQTRQGYGPSHPNYGQTGQGYSQYTQGYGQSQTRPVYGNSPTMNQRSHGGFLDGLFKGQSGQKSQGGLGSFLGQRKTHETIMTHETDKTHGHGKLLGQHHKKTHETNKNLNGLGMFIKNGEKKLHRKKKNKDGNGSGNESGSSSGSESD